VLVAGESFGCGSSREHAPLALKQAGIDLIVARSVERIFLENCVNLGGPLVSTDWGLLPKLRSDDSVDAGAVIESLDSLSKEIVLAGGLLRYSRQRMAGKRSGPRIETAPRPMTAAEKILARHLQTGNGCVRPGDVGFAKADLRYTYDLMMPMIDGLLRDAFGADWSILGRESVVLFNDHLALMDNPDAERLRRLTRDFSRNRSLQLHDSEAGLGAEGICHTIVLERYARPGQLIVATDSHTCTAGAVGALAFGIGVTEMASAFVTGEVRVRVPTTVRFEFAGRLRPGVCAKDVMLYVLSLPIVQDGQTVGRVMEYAGSGLVGWPLDELAVLTNMAVEAGAFAGLIEGSVLRRVRQVSSADDPVEADADAEYEAIIPVDLSAIGPMVAEPGDPRNAVPLEARHASVEVNIAYVGSCTSGKLSDLEACAQVLRGRRVHPSVRMYVQASSRLVAERARMMGLVDDIVNAGATFLGPGCGACCGLGPGTSVTPAEVTVSSTNRNYPGRMGKGKVYLASPAVVAASAVAGRITSPERLPAR